MIHPGQSIGSHSINYGTLATGYSMAVLAGVTLVLEPTLLILFLLLVCAGLLVVSPEVRLAFAVLGALATFQSSESVNTTKIIYLLGLVVCIAAALLEAHRLPLSEPSGAPPLLRACGAFGCFTLLSAFVALRHGTPMLHWFRDAAPYLLFSVCPVLALDARRCRRWYQTAVLILAGMISTLAFSFEWLDRHGLTNTLPHLGLPTFLLPAALFSLTSAGALHWKRHRRVALLMSSAILTLVLVTGTRLGVIFLVALIVIPTMSGRHQLSKISRPLIITAAAISAILTVTYFSGPLHIDSTKLLARLQAITVIINDPSSDPSYRDRQQQTKSALTAFQSSPIVGMGPGYSFEWFEVRGGQRSPTIDSPLAFPAKFGALGCLVLIVVVRAFIVNLRLTPPTADSQVWRSALLGYACIIATWMATNSPFEDKGLWLGALLLLALNWSSTHRDDEYTT
jgi:O-antigen ligase